MTTIMSGLEDLVYEAHKLKGWSWGRSEPLWNTWTLEEFGKSFERPAHASSSLIHGVEVTSIPALLVPYHRSLQAHVEIEGALRSHSISFEESRSLVSQWISQTHLETDEWVGEWEDLCSVEVDRWNTR